MDVIIVSRKISLHAWGILKEMPDDSPGAEAFRSAIQRVLEHLSLYGDHDYDTSGPGAKNTKNNTEVSRISLGCAVV